jgi:hypothetical protein
VNTTGGERQNRRDDAELNSVIPFFLCVPADPAKITVGPRFHIPKR